MFFIILLKGVSIYAFAYNKGIKHDFPFIYTCKVPREVLKTEGEARDFQHSRGNLRIINE